MDTNENPPITIVKPQVENRSLKDLWTTTWVRVGLIARLACGSKKTEEGKHKLQLFYVS